jgi:dUTP pyrophosphatase
MPVQFTYGVFPIEDNERKGGFGSTGS